MLQNEDLVGRILRAVVQAVEVPVTLKTRLGWDDEHKNILTVAKMAEQAGIAALAVHGRTRTQMYKGEAAYELIAEVKQQIKLPLWVNGDLSSPQKAADILRQTGADGVMIGRAAQGQPWLFRDIRHYLAEGSLPPPPKFDEAAATLLEHIAEMHAFYGEIAGVRIARKHIGWYLARLPEGDAQRRELNRLESAAEQYDTLAAFLHRQELAEWPTDYRNSAAV